MAVNGGAGRERTTTELVVGGKAVEAFNDSEFVKIRERYGLDEVEFLKSIDFSKMEQGGGKGGMQMGFTSDKLYIVKELNGSDHHSLSAIAAEYCEHVLAAEGSLIARLFAHFAYRGHNFVVMNNWMPPPRYEAAPAGLVDLLRSNFSQYDLKGCADDKTLKRRGESIPAVHKRVFNIPLWLGTLFWTEARQTYYSGKLHARDVAFHVSRAAHDDISAKVQRDVLFLQKCGLMDYSLVVSYHVLPRRDAEALDKVYRATSDAGAQPYVGHKDKQTFVVYLGIIDFLQDWTTAKVVANCIKVAERNKATIPPRPYGERFAQFVKDKFVPTCEPDTH
mmetsp:Transcript_15889/g.49764  ORF Transcript_15889/g.49764 Transcript_15889/m.49764 type:complete len:335 (+) Transcript_15889:100-1104(+)